MKKRLVISTSLDLVCIEPSRIVYISSDVNYSTLVQTDSEMRMLSYQLGQIEGDPFDFWVALYRVLGNNI